jgi:hypothetical protein
MRGLILADAYGAEIFAQGEPDGVRHSPRDAPSASPMRRSLLSGVRRGFGRLPGLLQFDREFKEGGVSVTLRRRPPFGYCGFDARLI